MAKPRETILPSILTIWLLLGVVNKAKGWREASKCTLGTTNSIENNEAKTNQLLNMDCGNDLIYIASSHYGHKTDENYAKKKEIILKNNLHHFQSLPSRFGANDTRSNG
jgi:hypothetical protein